MLRNRIFRDPAAGESGGGLPPTLADLFGDGGTPPESVEPPIEGGDGTPKPEDLEKAAQEAAAEEAKEGEETEEEKPKADEPAEEETAADPTEFFAAVEQLTGEPVAVEYGNTDPLSPEGVAIREKAVRQDEVLKFESHLKTNDPRAYAYFIHRSAGGDDASFFAKQTVSLPDEETFSASVAAQTSLYKQALIDRGVDGDIAESAVAKAIKDNTLGEKSLAVYNSIKGSQSRQLAEMEAESVRQQEAFNQQCETVISNLNTNIDNGSMKFIVPDAKKAGFKQYVKDSLRHEDGKFYAVSEIGGTPQNVLESLYFQYIRGDLKSLIEKRAETKAVQRLKLGVQKASGALPKGAGSEKRADTYVPLGSL